MLQRKDSLAEWIQKQEPHICCLQETHFRPRDTNRLKVRGWKKIDTIHQIDLIDIYRTLQPKTADYTFFSSAHGTFSRIDHILGHKSSLSIFKKIEIISSIFSDHNTMRLEINYRENNKFMHIKLKI